MNLIELILVMKVSRKTRKMLKHMIIGKTIKRQNEWKREWIRN